MPTYEYTCTAGHRFERLQSMKDAPVDTCPECGAPAERQLSAGAGLLFKGSGFYITDYRSDSYRKAAEADKGGSAADKGGSGTDKGNSGTDKGGSGADKAAASDSSTRPDKKDSGSKPAKSE
jgi:putative FmdB family regulatory protein